MPPLKCLLIGCGAMAGGYDLDASGRRRADGGWNTHAAVCAGHEDFTIVACVDPDEIRRKRIMAAWNIAAGYPRLADAVAASGDFDLAIVSTPTATHAEILSSLLALSPKGVFCEKPLTDNLSDGQAIVEAFEKQGVPLGVNYSRRWNPDVMALKESVRANAFGGVVAVQGVYSGGLLHNASHMIDLFHYLFGGCSPTMVQQFASRGEHDFDVSFGFSTPGGGSGFVASCDGAGYGLFEVDIYFERRVVGLRDWGRSLITRDMEPDPLVEGRQCLAAPQHCETGWKMALRDALLNMRDAIRQGAPLLSDGRSALRTQQTCEAIIGLGHE